MYEVLWIGHQLVPRIGMSIQIVIQLSMVLHIVVVLNDGGVSLQVILNIRMAMKKSSEVRHVSMHWVTIAHVRSAVEGIFLPHEGVRVLLYLVGNSRMVLEVSLQSRMVLHKVLIV